MPPPDVQRTDGRTLKAIPLRQKCIWPRYGLDLLPLTLKTYSAIPTRMMNIYGMFH